MVVKIGVDTSVLDKKINTSLKKVNDLSFAFYEIVRDSFRYNMRNFTLAGSGKYKPLSPIYEKQKTKRAGRKLPILVGASKGGESGRLRDSIAGSPNKESIAISKPTYAIIGTEVPYAPYVQAERPFLFFDESQEKRYVNIIEAEVNRQLERSGF